jgi:hypothetical protein
MGVRPQVSKTSKFEKSLLILKDLRAGKLKFQNKVPACWNHRKSTWLLPVLRLAAMNISECNLNFTI